MPTPIPAAPTKVFVNRLVGNTANAVKWDAVTTDITGAPLTVTSYKVYRTTQPNALGSTLLPIGSGDLFKTVSTTDVASVVDTLAVDSTIISGSTYFYFVSAVASAQESALSAEASDIP